jgi:hypothetical protein
MQQEDISLIFHDLEMAYDNVPKTLSQVFASGNS